MGVDGLVPRAFAALDRRGNLSQGILLAGVPCILLAFLVPFTALEELISAGVLLCFSLTDAALILLRLQDAEETMQSTPLPLTIWIYCLGQIITTHLPKSCELRNFYSGIFRP